LLFSLLLLLLFIYSSSSNRKSIVKKGGAVPRDSGFYAGPKIIFSEDLTTRFIGCDLFVFSETMLFGWNIRNMR
jgi:hypothetical protein